MLNDENDAEVAIDVMRRLLEKVACITYRIRLKKLKVALICGAKKKRKKNHKKLRFYFAKLVFRQGMGEIYLCFKIQGRSLVP